MPLIFISIRGVQRIFTGLFQTQTKAVFYITGLVLILHALAITLTPSLYTFGPGSTLFATAWLLWFGGITIVLQAVLSEK